MNEQAGKALLVGDNPFHQISHLSQERTRAREGTTGNPEYAADLLLASLQNGANGFMFSVSETTLSILRAAREKGEIDRLGLYAIVPYAYEYVKLATQLGGIPGLAKRLGMEVALSGNFRAVAAGLRGLLSMDLASFVKAYLCYEMGRIRSAAGKHANIRSMVLHEVVTDMALSLNLDWLFREYMKSMLKLGVLPGFNTCNFAYLVSRFNAWHIDLSKAVIVAPFNKVGFQMNPSRTDCEKALENMQAPVLVAISVLAAGYLKPKEAIDYIANLPNVMGVAVGVSNERHARETFALLKERLA